MPLILEFANRDEVAKRIGSMIGHISYFGGVEMPKEFGDWQTGDMHRKTPGINTSRWRNHMKTVNTTIRAHSLYEVTRSYARQAGIKWRKPKNALTARALRARLKRIEKRTPVLRVASTRPILRHSLYEQLKARLTAAFTETIKW